MPAFLPPFPLAQAPTLAYHARHTRCRGPPCCVPACTICRRHQFFSTFLIFHYSQAQAAPHSTPSPAIPLASWRAGAIMSLPALPSMHLLVEAPTIINHSTVLILAKPVCLNNYVNTLGCLGPIEMLPTLSTGRYLCTRDCHGARAPACVCSALTRTRSHTHIHTCGTACTHGEAQSLHKAGGSRMVELTGNSISLGAGKHGRTMEFFRYQSGWLS